MCRAIAFALAVGVGGEKDSARFFGFAAGARQDCSCSSSVNKAPFPSSLYSTT